MTDATKATATLSDGSKMPLFMIGTPDIPAEYATLPAVLEAGISLGFRGIDTAWFYGSEPTIGKTFKEIFAKGQVKREDLFITTKVWPSMWDKAEASLKKSLSDLGLDYVDLVLQHWPIGFKAGDDGLPKIPKDSEGKLLVDESADYLETYKQLIELKKKGLAKHIGVSNYTEKHLQRAIDETGVTPEVVQVELHPRLPSLELLHFAKTHGIVVEAYSPLGHNGVPLLKEPLVNVLAEKYACGPAFILYAYHMTRGVVVITRTSKVERVKSFKETPIPVLTDEEIKQLDQLGIDNPKRYIQDPWTAAIGLPYAE